MAVNQPNFAGAAVNVGSVVVSSSADTSYTAPTHAVTIVTGGTNGTKVSEIRVIGTGTSVLGVLNIFLYDGTTYHIVDSIAIPAVTASTTAVGLVLSKTYPGLIVPSATWTLVAATTVASQLLNVTAFGGNF